MVLRRSNVSLDPRMGERDVLRAVLFGEIPELAEASRRIVKPLPAGDLLYGTFWSIKSSETLGKALLLAEWFRRQLSVEKPVCGETAADLLLVIAAAEYALKLPSADVQKNRIAIFGAQVSRRKWRQVLHHVPSARKRLDEMQRVYPDVLECEAWPPTPAVDFRSPLNAKGDPDPPVERRLRTPEEIAEFKREREAAWAEAKRQHEAARAAAKK